MDEYPQHSVAPLQFECAMCGVCCGAGLEIFINSLDIWNLRNNFKQPSGMILEKYLIAERRPEFGSYPVCTIGMKAGRCPFQNENLCGIHPARPAGCRLFPAAQFYDGRGESRFVLSPERDFCAGVIRGSEKNLSGWLAENNFDMYEDVMKIQESLRPMMKARLGEREYERLSRILFDFDSFDTFPFRSEYPKAALAAKRAVEWVSREAADFMASISI